MAYGDSIAKVQKVGIIGGGTVGRAMARVYQEQYDVRVYDIMPERRTHSLPDALAGDVIFVCLPTPGKEDGSLDTSIIEQFFADHQGYTRNFVLKSTVPIGFTKRMAKLCGLTNLVHSPEFLTARCAMVDAQMPAQLLIGIPTWPVDGRAGQAVRILYRSRFPGVTRPLMDSDCSEAIKLFLNGFFAVKVAYFNEINTLVSKLRLDWEMILDGILGDGRVGASHTKVPGPDGKYGFGGDCLPKDLAAIVNHFATIGELCSVTRGAKIRNKRIDIIREVT